MNMINCRWNEVKLGKEIRVINTINCRWNEVKLSKEIHTMNMTQTHKRFKGTLFIRTKTPSANFRGNPLYKSTKRHSNS